MIKIVKDKTQASPVKIGITIKLKPVIDNVTEIEVVVIKTKL